MNNLRVLAVLLADIHTDLHMAALDLMVKGLADIMQQACAACQLNVHAKLASHQAGQPCHFQRMAQHILAVAGAILQAADQLDQIGMQAVDTKVHHSLFALALHLNFQFAAALIHGFLNAGRVDTAIGDQALQGHAGHFTAGLVKAGKGDGFRRIINNEVTASGSFQSADVAALAANDAALHLVRGQRHHADGGFTGGIGCAAGNGLADQLTGDGITFVLHVSLIGADLHGLFVGQLIVNVLQQHGAGIFLGHGGDGFQLFGLAQLELFQLVQAGFHQFAALFQVLFLALHGGGALIQRFLLLVHAAFLAADLRAAVLDFLVGVSFQLERLVFGLDDGFLALLLGSLDGIVHDAFGFLFGRADLGFGGTLPVFPAKIITKRPAHGSGNDNQHPHQNWGHGSFTPYKTQIKCRRAQHKRNAFISGIPEKPGQPAPVLSGSYHGYTASILQRKGLTFAVQILPAIFYTKWGDNPKHTQKRIHLKPHIHK